MQLGKHYMQNSRLWSHLRLTYLIDITNTKTITYIVTMEYCIWVGKYLIHTKTQYIGHCSVVPGREFQTWLENTSYKTHCSHACKNVIPIWSIPQTKHWPSVQQCYAWLAYLIQNQRLWSQTHRPTCTRFRSSL